MLKRERGTGRRKAAGREPPFSFALVASSGNARTPRLRFRSSIFALLKLPARPILNPPRTIIISRDIQSESPIRTTSNYHKLVENRHSIFFDTFFCTRTQKSLSRKISAQENQNLSNAQDFHYFIIFPLRKFANDRMLISQLRHCTRRAESQI